jgi:hypothetical protein
LSTVQQDFTALPLHRKLILGAGTVLLIASFLPWYKVSIGGFSASASGWHELGTVAWLFLIATLAFEGARLAKVAPVGEKQGDQIGTGLGAATVLFAIIFVIQRISDGHFGFGFYLGVLALIAFAYGVFLLFQSIGGKQALRDLQAQAESRRNQ